MSLPIAVVSDGLLPGNSYTPLSIATNGFLVNVVIPVVSSLTGGGDGYWMEYWRKERDHFDVIRDDNEVLEVLSIIWPFLRRRS